MCVHLVFILKMTVFLVYIFHCSLKIINVISPKHVGAHAEEGEC